MITVDKPTRSLQIALAGAVSTSQPQVVCTYKTEARSPNSIAASQNNTFLGITAGATAVTVMPAAGAGYNNTVQSMNIWNTDTAAVTISIQIIDTVGTVTDIYQKITLQTLEQLNYEAGYGFQALDINGAVKSQAAGTSSATSTADSKAVSAALVASASSSVGLIVSSLQSGASVQSFTSTIFSTVSSGLSFISTNASGASAQSFTSTTFSTVSSSASLGLVVSSLQSAASVQSFTSTSFSTVSSSASLGLLVSSLQSAASVQSFTSTTFSTVSSAISRTKSSFAW